MPGSTFKVLTTTIGLEDGALTLQTTFPDEAQWVPPQTDDPIENFGGTVCGGDLAEVFRRSCNIPFAKTAVELGPDKMVEGVEEWGLGEQIPDRPPLPATEGGEHVRSAPRTSTSNLPLLAIRGFGQESVQMVPLHMAMVAATVANGGKMMKPYVVDARLDHSGRVLDGDRAGGVEATDVAGHGADTDGSDEAGGHRRHGQLLHRAQWRHPGGGEDRHRPAQRSGRAGAFACVDHRLRSRRRPAVRGRRDARRAPTPRSRRAPAAGSPGRSPRPCSTRRWQGADMARRASTAAPDLAIEANLGSLNRRCRGRPTRKQTSCDP